MKLFNVGFDVVAVWLFILIICLMALFGCVPPSECRRMMQAAYDQGRADTGVECQRSQNQMYDYYKKNYERLTLDEIQKRNGGNK